MSDADRQAPGGWIQDLSGSGSHPPASRPSLVALATELIGAGALAWGVELGYRIATTITAEIPEFGGGEEEFQTLRMGNEAAVLGGMLLVATGEEGVAAAPQESLLGDREFVRRGIPLDLVLRGIRIGHAMVAQALLDAAAQLVREPRCTAEIQRTSQLLFDYIDSFSLSMSAEYLNEHDRWVTSAAAERAELVRSILAGDAVPERASSVLGYPLERHHIAFVLWHDPGSAGSPSELQRTAAQMLSESGCSSTLVVPYGASSLWVWATWRSRTIPRPELTPPTGRGTHVAVGTMCPGVEGFRHSHHEADRVAELARSATAAETTEATLTWYADVELAVMLAQDPALARAFVVRELGPLAVDTAATAELRDTVAAYLFCERSLAKAADILHVARNTVAYRVKKIENTTGRDLRHRRLELETALRLAHVLGPLVLETAAGYKERT